MADLEKEVERQIKIISRGTEEIIPLEDLRAKLRKSITTGEPLKVKFGVDPTSPDLHLGHAVPLRKMRHFQDLGHEVILLIGDFTAMIGDPSGRSTTRPPLSREEVLKNAETYTEQAFKVLDKERTVLRYNSEWLAPLSLEDILKLTSKFTVARLLERDDFAKRYQNQRPISLHEFLYPVMVAYDSVALECDVEMGGTDQKFNLLAGRELMKEMGLEPQVCLTMPILVGTDGVQKMSKSYSNYVGLTDLPEEMFGKVMSISDELMETYFRLCTDVPEEEIALIKKELKEGEVNPAEVKRRLAREIVQIYHGEAEAERAQSHFDRVFKERKLPENIPECELPPELVKPDGTIWIVKLITGLNLASSNSEARRLIEQGGVKLNGETVSSVELEIKPNSGDVIQVGKRRFAKIK
jgi:tyrosyl-tRNA synthetase